MGSRSGALTFGSGERSRAGMCWMRDWIASSEALRTVGLESHAAASALKRVLFAEVILDNECDCKGARCFEVSDWFDGNSKFVGRGCHVCVEGRKGGGVSVGYECPRLI